VVGLRQLSEVGEAVALVAVFVGFWDVVRVVAGWPLAVLLASGAREQAAIVEVGAPHREDDGPQV
jgi:hypothetical protein